MTPAYRIEDGILYIITGPRFDTEALAQVAGRALEDPEFKPPMSLLIDLRESEESASSQEIMRRASMLGEHRELFGGRAAVVVSDELHFGLSRIGSAWADGHGVNVEVFRDLDAAVVWLRRGLGSPQVSDS